MWHNIYLKKLKLNKIYSLLKIIRARSIWNRIREETLIPFDSTFGLLQRCLEFIFWRWKELRLFSPEHFPMFGKFGLYLDNCLDINYLIWFLDIPTSFLLDLFFFLRVFSLQLPQQILSLSEFKRVYDSFLKRWLNFKSAWN